MTLRLARCSRWSLLARWYGGRVVYLGKPLLALLQVGPLMLVAERGK